ncbi:hypothetical protein [Fonticella tunisiensis]
MVLKVRTGVDEKGNDISRFISTFQ